MEDYDITWKDISEAQNAAFEHAMRHAMPWLKRANRPTQGEWHPPITEFMVAEMMCLAEKSLWYTQAKGWAEGNNFPAQGADQVWKLAGDTIIKIVELGFKDDKWWDVEQLWSPSQIGLRLAAVLDAIRMLRVIRPRSLAIHSQWFEAIPYLVLPSGFKVEKAIEALGRSNGNLSSIYVLSEIRALYDSEFAKMLQAAKQEAREKVAEIYAPTECIHPECHNLVAPLKIKPREGHFKNYRGTGACQRGHNSFWCSRCEKPHSFTSKIGKNHYQYTAGDMTKELNDELKLQGKL